MSIKYSVYTPDFDSTLGRTPSPKDNATDLEVVLRLQFIAVDAQTAKDLRGKVFQMRPWDDGEIRQYIADFKDSVESHWSDRIYIPTGRCHTYGACCQSNPATKTDTPRSSC